MKCGGFQYYPSVYSFMSDLYIYKVLIKYNAFHFYFSYDKYLLDTERLNRYFDKILIATNFIKIIICNFTELVAKSHIFEL